MKESETKMYLKSEVYKDYPSFIDETYSPTLEEINEIRNRRIEMKKRLKEILAKK